jgi:PAS domain S-box-containing protein
VNRAARGKLASLEAVLELGDDVFKIIGDVVLEISLDGVYLRVIGAEDALAVAPEQLVGKRIGEVSPAANAASEALLGALARLREGAGSQAIEYHVPGRSGFDYYEARLVLATSGNALAFVRNVSDRKRAEQSVRESDDRFRAMADSAPVLLWMSGVDGLCNFFNQTWLRFTGRPLERELGNGWAEGVHPEDFQRCMHVYMDAFVARHSFAMTYRLRNADGEYRWLLDQGRPRFDPDGSFLGFIGSCVDVTEERLTREALGRLNEDLEGHGRRRTAQLEVANRELEAFAYSVSHDLRAPLRALGGYSQLLLEEYGERFESEAQVMLTRMRDASQRMARLIDDLLHLSRVTRMEMRREPVDLTEIAHEIFAELIQADPDREVVLEVAPGMTASGDPVLLRVLMDNLLRNAWKFTGKQEHPRIQVGEGRAPDGRRAYFVRDNGAGFEMAYANKLFGVFQRLHSEAEFPGTGIGLATVQRIVSRHGGRVWAESAVGEGATFHFCL